MKNKKRILIIAFIVILFLLVLLLAFFAGKAAGKKYGDVTLGSANEESSQEENADNAQPAVSASAPPEEITDTETTPVPQEDKPQVTETPQVTQVPQATEQPVPNGALEAKPTEEPTTGNVGEEVTEEGELLVYVDSFNSWGENPVFHQLTITLTNTMDKDINGWTLHINVGDAALTQGWGGNYSINNGILTVTNVDYSAIVPAGGTQEIGCILSDITGDYSYTTEINGTQAPTATNPNQNQGGNQPQQNPNTGGNQATSNPEALDVPEPTTDDWLHVEGNKIVDKDGKQVWLTGVNWFGYNTGTNIFDGIWNSDLNTSIQSIADHGFNLIRIPMSAELILQWKNGQYPTANYNNATNYYLVGMNSLEIFDYIIGQFRACGLKVMIDIHSAKTDSMGHMTNLWYSGDITTEKYQEALVWMAERYAQDDTIIAYDLKNEPHGKPYEQDKAIWNDSKDKNNWKYIAEQTALKVLEKNPNVLIMVEGTEIYPIDIKTNSDYSSTNDKDYHFNWWGGNLRGVADYPIDLGEHQDQLVYSPHDYGPTVYQQPWFKAGYNYDSLYKDCWHDNWLYIHEDGTAPLLIGEWGGFMREPNLTWMTHMRSLIKNYHLHHTFWCFNANSGDTGGLVLDDFKTWDEQKYNFVKEALWQENGKFVGLDHEIPLGTAGNGITLSEAKGLNK